jgi:hypothetical protein
VGYIGEVRLVLRKRKTHSQISLIFFFNVKSGTHPVTTKNYYRTIIRKVECCPLFCPIARNLQKIPPPLPDMENCQSLLVHSLHFSGDSPQQCFNLVKETH